MLTQLKSQNSHYFQQCSISVGHTLSPRTCRSVVVGAFGAKGALMLTGNCCWVSSLLQNAYCLRADQVIYSIKLMPHIKQNAFKKFQFPVFFL